jgi:tRNA (mo5U34)-methyltransferase
MSSELEARVAEVDWYHTIDLPGGVATPGEFDHRPIRKRLPLPASLEGKRCLDVGTHDGFWAFEMERRGAAEVVAIDLEDPESYDWPQPPPELSPDTREHLARRRSAFRIAHEALGSSVERRDTSVYALDPETIGTFDFAFIGTLLLHLRNPIGALASIARVLRGPLLVNDAVVVGLSVFRPRRPAVVLMGEPGIPIWWTPNAAGLRRYVEAGGFRVYASSRPYLVPNGAGAKPMPLREGRRLGSRPVGRLMQRRGMFHVWVLAEPQDA